MKAHYAVALAVVTGFGLGAVVVQGLHAQAKPPAYLLAEVQVTDPDTWKQYIAALPGTLAPYKTRTLARANPVALDNSAPPAGSLVIIAFNNMEDVKAFWNSPAYQDIIPLREKSAKTRVYAVEGMPQ